ncbi:MAG: HD family phosphohydrolase [Candidatus Aminicenantia bacterium]
MRQKIFSYPALFGFIFVLLLTFLLSYSPSHSLPELEVGEIASSDISAPTDMTIEDEDTTNRRRQEAIDSVLPVYEFNKRAFLNIETQIRDFFNFGREELSNKKILKDKKQLEETRKIIAEKFELEISLEDLAQLVKIEFDKNLEENLISLIAKISSQGTVLSKNLFIYNEEKKGLTIIYDEGNEKNVKVEDVLDLTQAKKRIFLEIDLLEISPREKKLLKSLASLLITPNISFNKFETESRKSQAAASAEPVYYNLKKGKIIIRKGDEVSPEIVKLIRAVNQNLKKKPSWIANFSGIFFLFALLFIALWFYLKSILPSNERVNKFLMFGPTLILSLVLYKFFIFLSNLISQNSSLAPFNFIEIYRYVLPYQLGVFLFVFLTTPHLALIYSILNSLAVGYLFKGNFELMIFSFISGLAAIYGVKYYQTRKRVSILKAAIFVVGPVNMFIILTFHLISEKFGSYPLFFGELLMGLTGAIIAAGVATSLFPLFEYVYRLLTDIKLLELCNLDLPILRQLAIEAPGTYHHSLIVASLAEEAANEIKLNPMVLRAAALYHDIGKLKRPEYFIENQPTNPSVHKELTPRMSTLVIVNHVKEGIEMANKLKLPSKIKEIIQQHHGTSLMKYFYYKAKETYNPEMQKIGEEIYRYPGPKPQTKEAAIIMLADSVEAASRSLKSPTSENFKKVIKEIFDNYLVDGQFDECDITLKELMMVAPSFLKTLNTIYHPRLKYPGFDFEKTNKKRKPLKNEG